MDSRRSGTPAGSSSSTYRFDRSRTPGRDLRHRHATTHRVAARACGPHVLLHPHRCHRPLPAHARARRLLPDGLGRQRAAHRAPGAEPLPRALRPDAALRARPSSPPGRASRDRRSPCRARTSSSLPAADRRGRAGLRGPLAAPRPVGRLVADLRHHRRPLPGGSPSCPSCAPGQGQAYPVDAPTLWDVDFQTAVAQAELEDREAGRVPPAHLRAREGRTVDIDTTRPELLAACVALVAHPDDEPLPGLFGTHGHAPRCSASRCRCLPTGSPSPTKGTGIPMVCTFGDATDVLWWRELGPARCGRSGPRRAPPAGHLGPARARERRPGGRASVRRAGSPAASPPGPQAHGRAAAPRPARWPASPGPVTHAVKFYEKGDQPLEILTTRQWFVRNVSLDKKQRPAGPRRAS